MSPGKLTQVYEDLKDGVRRGEAAKLDDELRELVLVATSAATRRATGAFGRVLEVRALAERVFGDEKKSDAWLNRPNPSLSGQVPIELLNDEIGAAVVRETLEQIDHGIFS